MTYFWKIRRKITAPLSADGTPVAIIEASVTWIKGTGQFKNIHGVGTAKGRYISKNIYTGEWEGEYRNCKCNNLCRQGEMFFRPCPRYLFGSGRIN
jgi:hypothetical protein